MRTFLRRFGQDKDSRKQLVPSYLTQAQLHRYALIRNIQGGFFASSLVLHVRQPIAGLRESFILLKGSH